MPTKSRTSYNLPEEVLAALGHTAVELKTSKSELVADALRLYLPTISNLPQVSAIAKPVAA